MTIAKQKQIPNILIVDDTPANVLLLERMLTERGYNARTVLSGRLALQAARSESPDLILLDIAMPQMDGYEVCGQLKADSTLKEIPVIFISALNETIDKVKAFGAGGVDYVTKPFQLEEVIARVQTHLELRRLEKLRDDLTHMVVHDLRNPLSVVFGFLDILDREAKKLSPSARTFLPLARLCSEEMLTMIGSILDVSRMGAGEMKLQLVPCDLVTLIRDALATSPPLSASRTVTFNAPDSSPTVTADVGLIRRVLKNLLSNALKHTPAGGNVRIVVLPSPGEVRIEVIDSGPGIEPEFHERIFEKFSQLEDGNNSMGTGLGLTFCKLAVEAHGGRIGVDSKAGKGSTFWWVLPTLESEIRNGGVGSNPLHVRGNLQLNNSAG